MNRATRQTTGGEARRQVIIVSIASVCLLAAMAVLFERVDERLWIGMRDEARTQPMLAAGRMLRRLGIDAREVARDGWPNDDEHSEADVLLVWNPPRRDARAEVQALARWVRSGGHLVTTPERGAREEFRRWLVDGDEWPEDDPDGTVPPSRETPRPVRKNGLAEDDSGRVAWGGFWRSQVDTAALSAAIDAADGAHFKDVEGARWTSLDARAHRSEGSARGACEPLFGAHSRIVAIDCTLDLGFLTLVEDSAVFLNHRLGELGHAQALASIVDHGYGTSVLIDLGIGETRPLFSWIRHQAPLAVLLGALGVLLLVWARSRRFGPIFDIPARRRRALIEHLRAVGQFAWRQDHGAGLVSKLSQAVEARAAARIPGWTTFDRTQQLDELATRAGISVQRLAEALDGTATQRRRAEVTVARVRTLNHLWRSL